MWVEGWESSLSGEQQWLRGRAQLAWRREACSLRGADRSENTTRSRGNALQGGGRAVVLTDPKDPMDHWGPLELVVPTHPGN